MPNSVSEMIVLLKQGKSTAERDLWNRFIEQLIRVSRSKLGHLPRRVVDEEDVALEAFDAFFRGAKEGRFQQLDNRDDLWQVLTMLAERKSIEMIRKEKAEKRGGGKQRGESVFEEIFKFADRHTGIGDVADLKDGVFETFTIEVRERLNELQSADMKRIAIMRLEGFEVNEIAKELCLTKRTVERKLQLIRRQWDCISD